MKPNALAVKQEKPNKTGKEVVSFPDQEVILSLGLNLAFPTAIIGE